MKISVITISRNAGATVDRTIASVRSQTYPLEWVVIDGGSTDDSPARLRAALHPGDQMISEPDQGISDAFNKGLALATGDAILFMNAGDEFASPTALSDLLSVWDRRFAWITGGASVCREDGTELYVRRHGMIDPWFLVDHGCRIFHQATLAERSLFQRHGFFSLHYRSSMDYDLWLRWMMAGHLPQVVDTTVCRFRVGGVSGDTLRRFREDVAARTANGRPAGRWTDLRLQMIAHAKYHLGFLAGPTAYRFKERLGW